MDYKYIKSLINLNYNIIELLENKTPKKAWKQFQDEKIKNISKSDHYGMICGFSDVECIDVDLKVLPSKILRDDFIKSLTDLIDNHIENWKEKIVIKKTRNFGYHFIYKAKNLEGNLKLAKIKNYEGAIIETRGVGGYICMYPAVFNLNYHEIKYITDEERDILIGICRILNETEEDPIFIPQKTVKKYTVSDKCKTPWDDFNNKNNIFDIIGADFTIVKELSDKIAIRRIGATSPHSGYVFKDSGCMYLFSTGTIYDANRLITPFIAHTIKNYNGDFEKSSSDAYANGYGERHKPKKIVIKDKKIFIESDFPLDVFPKELTYYIKECARTLHNSIDYMSCALLWVGSLCVGNSIRVEVKKGWQEPATIWMALVGEAGIGKSPSINSIIFPLEKINGEERRRYQRDKKAFDEYKVLDKKEKKLVVEIQEPKRTQFIVDDVTMEALINLHSHNQNGIGAFKDELASWFKDMNKYKEKGSDKEQWLSSWSGKGIAVDRITRQSDYISKPIFPVLGGIQPNILAGFFTEENIDNGFLDRMLFSYPNLEVENYVEEEMDQEVIDYFKDFIQILYTELKKIVNYTDFGDIEPNIARLNKEAKKEWRRIFNEITIKQTSDETNEVIKSMLAKQKSYVLRFALILNTIEASWNNGDLFSITKDNILKAEKISKYFIAMNEKMILNNMETSFTKKMLRSENGGVYDKIKAVFLKDKNFNRSTVASELNISRVTLYKYLKEIER